MKLDLGSGRHKKEGFLGVDSINFPEVDIVHDLTTTWPWSNDSITEVHCSHVVEHFTADERVFFVNELYRVLKPGAKASIITPHWCSSRAYGDLTHQWPPVSEFWFFYLDKSWREQNAPHNTFYTCDFESTWGYGLHPILPVKNAEFQQFALNFYKEAAQDTIATLTKK